MSDEKTYTEFFMVTTRTQFPTFDDFSEARAAYLKFRKRGWHCKVIRFRTILATKFIEVTPIKMDLDVPKEKTL